ncbi:unnamed protein product, partial [Prorocentrum cordatum]
MINDLKSVSQRLFDNTEWLARCLSGSKEPPPGDDDAATDAYDMIIADARAKTPMRPFIKEYVINEIELLPGATGAHRRMRTRFQNLAEAIGQAQPPLFRHSGTNVVLKLQLDYARMVSLIGNHGGQKLTRGAKRAAFGKDCADVSAPRCHPRLASAALQSIGVDARASCPTMTRVCEHCKARRAFLAEHYFVGPDNAQVELAEAFYGLCSDIADGAGRILNGPSHRERMAWHRDRPSPKFSRIAACSVTGRTARWRDCAAAPPSGIHGVVLDFDGALLRVTTLAQELGLLRVVQEIRRTSGFECALKARPQMDAPRWSGGSAPRSGRVAVERIAPLAGDGGNCVLSVADWIEPRRSPTVDDDFGGNEFGRTIADLNAEMSHSSHRGPSAIPQCVRVPLQEAFGAAGKRAHRVLELAEGGGPGHCVGVLFAAEGGVALFCPDAKGCALAGELARLCEGLSPVWHRYEISPLGQLGAALDGPDCRLEGKGTGGVPRLEPAAALFR